MEPRLNPLTAAMKFLATQAGATTVDDFRRRQGNSKLEGLESQGWARRKDGMVALTRAGYAQLQRVAPVQVDHE